MIANIEIFKYFQYADSHTCKWIRNTRSAPCGSKVTNILATLSPLDIDANKTKMNQIRLPYENLSHNLSASLKVFS